MEITALGLVLSDESVGVLVESTFPRMAGVGEAALGVKCFGDSLMIGELLAVVIGERVDKFGMRSKCFEQNFGDWPWPRGGQSQTLRLLGAVATKTAVAPDLTADRGLVPIQHGRNPALAMTRFQKCLNLVAFFMGELRVVSIAASHACRFERL